MPLLYILNLIMRTGLDFKFAQFDVVRGKAGGMNPTVRTVRTSTLNLVQSEWRILNDISKEMNY